MTLSLLQRVPLAFSLDRSLLNAQRSLENEKWLEALEELFTAQALTNDECDTEFSAQVCLLKGLAWAGLGQTIDTANLWRGLEVDYLDSPQLALRTIAMQACLWRVLSLNPITDFLLQDTLLKVLCSANASELPVQRLIAQALSVRFELHCSALQNCMQFDPNENVDQLDERDVATVATYDFPPGSNSIHKY